METITIAKNNFSIEAMYVLKCHMYGKLKIPCSAIFISKLPMLNFREAIKAIKESKTKYAKIKTLLDLFLNNY